MTNLTAATVHPTLHRARQAVWEGHQHDARFVGSGIGYRRRAGQVTDELSVIAMVTKKLPSTAVSSRSMLPTSVSVEDRSWGVDVVEVGPILGRLPATPSREVATPASATAAATPPRQGDAVFNAKSSSVAGTLGCFVKDSSGRVALLSCASIIARINAAALGEAVDAIDGAVTSPVASLSNAHALTPAGNTTDAALAVLSNQTNYTQAVAGNKMAAISATHPAVGLFVAADQQGLNGFLAPMSTTLSQLGATLVAATPTQPCVTDATIGMAIEKVGAASGYSSGTVDAVGVQMKVAFPAFTAVFQNMIWTQAFGYDEDSGAVACAGGDGRHFVQKPSTLHIGCALLSSAGKYYALPLTQDNALTSQLRDQFLSQSLTGNLLIGLTYANTAMISNRFNTTPPNSVAQSYASSYYAEYKPILQNALNDPTSTSTTLTEDNYSDFNFWITSEGSGAGGAAPLLTATEEQVFLAVLQSVIKPCIGMDYQQILAYMNRQTTYRSVLTQLQKIPGFTLYGTVPGR